MSNAGRNTQEAASTDRNDRDRALFERFVGGDQEGFRRLYQLYEKPLILYCEYLLRTQHEAQDVFQETWLRIVRLRDRGTRIENFRAMLFTIARNLALNQIGHQKHATMMNVSLEIVGHESESMASRGGEPYQEVEELVNKALQRLPVVQREAFVLHAILGYTFQEIAEMQGSTMTAAKTRAFRARSFLRKLVSNWLGLAEEESPNDDDAHREESLSPYFLHTRA